MPKNPEQLEAIAELSAKEFANLRKFQALPENSIGIDGIDIPSCWGNGRDTCKELGISEKNGFSDSEIDIAVTRFAVQTACLFELI